MNTTLSPLLIIFLQCLFTKFLELFLIVVTSLSLDYFVHQLSFLRYLAWISHFDLCTFGPLLFSIFSESLLFLQVQVSLFHSAQFAKYDLLSLHAVLIRKEIICQLAISHFHICLRGKSASSNFASETKPFSWQSRWHTSNESLINLILHPQEHL